MKNGVLVCWGGDRLNVDTILERSVRKAANTIRITAQLINVQDGYHLWSQTYERQLEDIFDIQEDISKAIVNSLKLELEIGSETSIIHKYTDNIKAYNLYLQGRYFWNKRSREGIMKSIDYFEAAIEEDPEYALAYTGLADSYNVLGDWVFLPSREAYPKARIAAAESLNLDSTLAEAQASIAFITYVYDWDWPEAERLFKKAISLNPRYASAHQWYAEFLTTQGRYGEAHTQIEEAKKLDPLSPIIRAVQAELYFFERRYELAETHYLEVLEIEPDFYPAHYFLRWIYERTNKYQKASNAWDKFMQLEGANQDELKSLQKAFEESDIRGVYRSWLAKLRRDARIKYVSPINFVTAHIALGEYDAAFEWLEKQYEEHSNMNVYLNVWPQLDRLRPDPRFKDLLTRVGFKK